MTIDVYIPTALQAFTGAEERIAVPGSTVGEALSNLTERFTELRQHLYNEHGKLRSFVNVYVNDEDIRYLGHENTPLKAQDVVSIVPSIAGGIADGGSP